MSKDLALNAVNGMNMQGVLVAPESAGQIAIVVPQMASADPDREQKAEDARRVEMLANYGFTRIETEQEKSFAFAGGLAFIPVHGMLINRFGRSWGYVTGYNFIRSQMDAAAADPDVKGIVFDLNSFGGMVAGCFELSRDIKAIGKPTLGVIDSACYSACYAIGSACDKLVATPSSGAGSIGVIAMHVSVQKAMEEYGVEITIIASGEHKADGNPYEKLPEGVRKNMQKSVDTTRAEFVALVAENRGMDTKAIHDTEAQSYRASDAVSIGLIDAITSPSKAVSAFHDELSGSKKEETTMSTTDKTQPTAESSAADINAADINAAVVADRKRASSILNCEEAKGHSALATQLAYSGMSLEDAKATLLAAGADSEAAKASTTAATTVDDTNPLVNAMKTADKPNVGADSNKDSANKTQAQIDDEQGNALVRDLALATGRKLQ